MKKVFVDVTVKVIMSMDDEKNANDVMLNIYHEFSTEDTDVDILDSQISDWEFTDSK